MKNLKTNSNELNIGLDLFKKIAHNCNKYCGDNTTSSTLIGTEIYKQGFKYVNSGGNPVAINKGIL